MLDVIFLTHNSEKPLAHSLASLVPAVVDGMVLRVAVVDDGSTDETALVAEAAGCSFHETWEIDASVAGLNAPWVMVLQPGALFPDGWSDSVRSHIEKSRSAVQFTAPQRGKLSGLLGLFGQKRTLDAGLLIKRDQLQALLHEGVALADIPQRLKPARIKQVVLSSR